QSTQPASFQIFQTVVESTNTRDSGNSRKTSLAEIFHVRSEWRADPQRRKTPRSTILPARRPQLQRHRNPFGSISSRERHLPSRGFGRPVIRPPFGGVPLSTPSVALTLAGRR